MIGGAVVGGIILAMIEGVSLGLSRISGQMQLNEQSNFWYRFKLKQNVFSFNFKNLIVEQARAANGTNWFFFLFTVQYYCSIYFLMYKFFNEILNKREYDVLSVVFV